MPRQRQNILVLYLADSALDSTVIGWTRYDGGSTAVYATGDDSTPPYETGLDALRAGWRVIQFPQLIPPYPGQEYATSFLKHEFIFEQLEDFNG